jgi:hypothetical protein
MGSFIIIHFNPERRAIHGYVADIVMVKFQKKLYKWIRSDTNHDNRRQHFKRLRKIAGWGLGKFRVL